MGDFDAVGVDEFAAAIGLGIVRGEYADGAGGIGGECPLNDVEVMGTPIGDVSTGVFAVGSPCGVVVVDAAGAEDGVVWADGCGAEPLVPIEAGFGGFFWQVTPGGGDADADVDAEERADAALAYEVNGLAEAAVVFGALLAAGLKDDAVLADRFDGEAAFGEGERERFFAVDVFLRRGGIEDHVDVPVVGRGDDDGVDIRAGEEFVVVFGGGDAGSRARGVGVVRVGGGFGVGAAGGIDIAHTDDLNARVLKGPIEVAAILDSHADEAEAQASVGARRAGSGHACECEGTCGEESGGCGEEGSAVHGGRIPNAEGRGGGRLEGMAAGDEARGRVPNGWVWTGALAGGLAGSGWHLIIGPVKP